MLYQVSFSNAYGETVLDSAVFQHKPKADSHASLLRRLGFTDVQVIAACL